MKRPLWKINPSSSWLCLLDAWKKFQKYYPNWWFNGKKNHLKQIGHMLVPWILDPIGKIHILGNLVYPHLPVPYIFGTFGSQLPIYQVIGPGFQIYNWKMRECFPVLSFTRTFTVKNFCKNMGRQVDIL